MVQETLEVLQLTKLYDDAEMKRSRDNFSWMKHRMERVSNVGPKVPFWLWKLKQSTQMAVDTGTVPVWPVLVTLWTWNSLQMALMTMLNILTPQNLQCRNKIRLMKPKLLDYPSPPVFNRGGRGHKIKTHVKIISTKNLQK